MQAISLPRWGDPPGLRTGPLVSQCERLDMSYPRNLDHLGVPPAWKEQFTGSGLLLVSGPRRSGRSWSLLAALGEMSERGQVAVSIESSVELVLARVQQVDLQADGHRLLEALQLLDDGQERMLAIEELTDADSAQAALQMAAAGSLVVAGLEADCCADALLRLQTWNLPESLLPQLRAVCSQRLVPSLCQSCLGAGCGACQSGRVGLCLLLEYATRLPPRWWQLPEGRLPQSLLDLGLYSLQQAAHDKVRQGLIPEPDLRA